MWREIWVVSSESRIPHTYACLHLHAGVWEVIIYELAFFVTRALAANKSDGASLQARTCSLAWTSIHHRHLLAEGDKLRHASFYANHLRFTGATCLFQLLYKCIWRDREISGLPLLSLQSPIALVAIYFEVVCMYAFSLVPISTVFGMLPSFD